MFTCRNQPCGANWEVSDVDIHNEGQGLLFRCPLCGARNHVIRHEAEGGVVSYEQDDSVPVKSEPAAPPQRAPRGPVKGAPRAPANGMRGRKPSGPASRPPTRTPTKRGR